MTDTVPHAVPDGDGDGYGEPDGLIVPLLHDVADEQKDTDVVGDDETVTEIVGDVESVPDTDCDTEPVPHDDAVKETDVVPHALVDGDTDDDVEADGAVDPPLVTVPDELNELDSVVEIVGEKVGVTDPDCDTELVPHGDAV